MSYQPYTLNSKQISALYALLVEIDLSLLPEGKLHLLFQDFESDLEFDPQLGKVIFELFYDREFAKEED